MIANNLAMVALTSRMQHERNYNDEQLQRLTGMRRLDIDPTRVEMGWIMDFCAQSLRNIIIGLGGRMDGYTMQSGFGIAVGSELMAMLSIVNDLADLRKRTRIRCATGRKMRKTSQPPRCSGVQRKSSSRA